MCSSLTLCLTLMSFSMECFPLSCTFRSYLCLNFRGHREQAYLGSLPHSNLTWRVKEWRSRYVLVHLVHMKSSVSAGISMTSTSLALDFFNFLARFSFSGFELHNASEIFCPRVNTTNERKITGNKCHLHALELSTA